MTIASNTLISADRLMAALAQPEPPLVVDTGFDLADVEAGRRAWQAGHVPGSIYLHLDDDLSGPKSGSNGRHPLPDRRVFAERLGRLGVTPTTRVVALDRQGGSELGGARQRVGGVGGHQAVSGGVLARSGGAARLRSTVAKRPATTISAMPASARPVMRSAKSSTP